MQGKRGLIMGVANDHSIAWGIAETLAAPRRRARLHLSGRGLRQAGQAARRIGRRRAHRALRRRGHRVASTPCSRRLDEQWGRLDFLVHAIAFSDKNELKGRYADTTRENFLRTMVISCFSFTEVAKRAAALMPNGGRMVTLTYNGGDARHAELQRHGRRQGGARGVGALSRGRLRRRRTSASTRISAGPIRTLAGAGINDAR